MSLEACVVMPWLLKDKQASANTYRPTLANGSISWTSGRIGYLLLRMGFHLPILPIGDFQKMAHMKYNGGTINSRDIYQRLLS
jgi:hypothetical protein